MAVAAPIQATPSTATRLRWGVVVFPGSNCDLDTLNVLNEVLGQEAHPVWHEDRDLSGFDAVVLPGGFAHGDYLRAGAVARFSPVMDAVSEFAIAGKPVLGICNGFQVLLEAGLLPGAMLRNRTQSFQCKWVHLRVESTATPFMTTCRPGEVLRMPIAHGEGNYFADTAEMEEMRANRQILVRYCGPTGELDPRYNPNGSIEHIAGVCNRAGNVMGLMPHPERAAEAVLGSADGRKLFEGLVLSLTR
jgi:phosphoribosylformylglycinamidine synthase subunit PurQ / glutaminase